METLSSTHSAFKGLLSDPGSRVNPSQTLAQESTLGPCLAAGRPQKVSPAAQQEPWRGLTVWHLRPAQRPAPPAPGPHRAPGAWEGGRPHTGDPTCLCLLLVGGPVTELGVQLTPLLASSSLSSSWGMNGSCPPRTFLSTIPCLQIEKGFSW